MSDKANPDKTRIGKALKISGVAILGVLVAWYAANSLEYYNEPVQHGWSDKGRLLQFLAAEQLLASEGIATTQVSHLDNDIDLDDYGTIFLPSDKFVPRLSTQRKIQGWLENGGFLLVGVRTIDKHSFLYDYGFRTVVAKDSETSDAVETLTETLIELNEEIDAQQSSREEQGWECRAPQRECDALIEPERSREGMGKLTFSDDQVAYFDFDGNYYLEVDDVEVSFDETDGGVIYQKRAVGDGHISIFTDFSIFYNGRLAHFDHAFLLYKLVQGYGPVLMVSDFDSPSLIELLVKNFLLTIISSALLLSLFLLYSAKRFGPAYRFSSQVRRALSEKLHAASQFHWRVQNQSALLDHLRDDVDMAAHRLVSNYRDLDKKIQLQVLAEHADIDRDLVTQAMQRDLDFQETTFVQVVATLQELRKTL